MDEQVGKTHDDGRHRQKFPQDRNFAECFVIMEIIGKHQHDATGRHPHKKGHLARIKSPGYIPALACDHKAVGQLIQVE